MLPDFGKRLFPDFPAFARRRYMLIIYGVIIASVIITLMALVWIGHKTGFFNRYFHDQDKPDPYSHQTLSQ